MKYKIIQQKINEAEPIWSCHPDSHEVGCPHKYWTKEELWEALIIKKKFEASRLSGKRLTR